MKRTHIIGDEWLYIKIYCGPKTADRFLSTNLPPFISQLLSKKLISCWFFIRYNDPDFHIRLRFHLSGLTHLSSVVNGFYTLIEALINQSLVWKVQVDTYEREVERYGIKSINLVEKFFQIDSEIVTEIISSLTSLKGEESRWLLCIKCIDYYLDSFLLPTHNKMEILSVMSESFENEFNLSRQSILQLNNKFRSERSNITNFIEGTSTQIESSVVKPIFMDKSDKTKEICILIIDSWLLQGLQPFDVIPSIIHMHCNRLFNSKQRINEMVIYRFLFQYYKSLIAKDIAKNKK